MARHGKDGDDGDKKQSKRDSDGQWPKGRPIPTHDPAKGQPKKDGGNSTGGKGK